MPLEYTRATNALAMAVGEGHAMEHRIRQVIADLRRQADELEKYLDDGKGPMEHMLSWHEALVRERDAERSTASATP